MIGTHPKSKKRPPIWTQAEIAILRESYPKIGFNCSALLPGRTRNAVKKRAIDMGIKSDRTHGHSVGDGVSPTYSSWRNMLARCYTATNPNYKHYGGRGITVCAQWNSFKNFHADMGDRPPEMSLDRIDVNGNYEPSNCRWASRKTQAENQRKTIWLEIGDKRLTLCQWAVEVGMSQTTIWNRYQKGVRGEELFRPTKNMVLRGRAL